MSKGCGFFVLRLPVDFMVERSAERGNLKEHLEVEKANILWSKGLGSNQRISCQNALR
jgi:hypothetical protein